MKILDLKYFIITYILTIISLYSQIRYQLNGILVVCGLSFVVCFFIKNKHLKNLIYIAGFCSLADFIHSSFFWLHAALICLFNIVLYELFKEKFIGHGGKLGSLSFLSTFLYFLIGNIYVALSH